MQVHLVDGTYELFRHFFALPSHHDDDGIEVAAVRGVLYSVLTLLEEGATHVGVANDKVIESFRNELYAGYKTSAGVDPALLAQFPLLDDSLAALGVAVWPMVEQEADDALAAAANVAAPDRRVEQVVICTPDKDLGQCVVDGRVVQLDRRRNQVVDEDGVVAKFGVRPESIPDFLALVSDSADGFPGVPGWGAKSTAAVLAHYVHLDAIPRHAEEWKVDVRGAKNLANALDEHRDLAELFRVLATLRTDAPVGVVDDWEWTGPAPELQGWAERLDARRLYTRAAELAERRAGSRS